MSAYLRMYARLAGGALALVEPHVVVNGQEIMGSYALRIVRGCDAVDAQVLLASALLASHTYAWRFRIIGAIAGFVLITVANVIRICTLYFVGAYWPARFDFFHHELWPLALIVLAATAFVGWAKVARARGETRHVLASA